MRILYLLIVVCLLSNCAPKKTVESIPGRSDTASITTTPVNEEAGTVKRDTLFNKPTTVKTTLLYPNCIKELISKFAGEEPKNPRRKITSYQYKNATVYYVPAVCCDNYSDLYDSQCGLIGHPDGGFTGRGDGKIVDFANHASHQTLIWEDKRK